LEVVGLKHAKDRRIGDMFYKGISGGEKRRLSIALEVLVNKDILVLDEPTSGLDSLAAKIMLEMLHNVARQFEKIIIISVQQPSSILWEMFDRVVLLSKGRSVYEGPREHIIGAFESVGKGLRPNHNPADHIVNIVNVDYANEEEKEANGSNSIKAEEKAIEIIEDLRTRIREYLSQIE
jgi:ABC-type multidrug transport system ATPase subunit